MLWVQEAASLEESDAKLTVFQSLVHQLPPPHYRSVTYSTIIMWTWRGKQSWKHGEELMTVTLTVESVNHWCCFLYA